MEKALKKYKKAQLINLIIDYENENQKLTNKIEINEKQVINLENQLENMEISNNNSSQNGEEFEEDLNTKIKRKYPGKSISIAKTIEYIKKRYKQTGLIIYKEELTRILKILN